MFVRKVAQPLELARHCATFNFNGGQLTCVRYDKVHLVRAFPPVADFLLADDRIAEMCTDGTFDQSPPVASVGSCLGKGVRHCARHERRVEHVELGW